MTTRVEAVYLRRRLEKLAITIHLRDAYERLKLILNSKLKSLLLS